MGSGFFLIYIHLVQSHQRLPLPIVAAKPGNILAAHQPFSVVAALPVQPVQVHRIAVKGGNQAAEIIPSAVKQLSRYRPAMLQRIAQQAFHSLARNHP